MPDSIELKWELPKPENEMTEDDWDALAEQALDDIEAAVTELNRPASGAAT